MDVMDPFAGYAHVDNAHLFWIELDDLLQQPFLPPPPHTPSATHNGESSLSDAKRIYVISVLSKFLHLCAACFDVHLGSEYHQHHCIQRLFHSTAFREDADDIPMHQLAAEEAIRIMQTSTSIPVLLMVYEIVLQYGDAFPSTYKSIQASASTVSFAGVRAFLHRLVHQIWAGSYAAQAEAKIGISDQAAGDPSSSNGEEARSFHTRGLTSSSASKDMAIQISLREKAVRMLYEVCRVQKLQTAHLRAFDERFIHHLFDLVEETRFHHDEDFNYRLIKLLVAINEQYMVASLSSIGTAASSSTDGQIHSGPLSGSRPVNLVLNILQQRLNASKTFGENLIFMLNRASSSDADDVCMQLLVLKLLYLLFTTKETACYFYTNDLRVLVDIFIRELSDLPDESESLRHTYLRVLHPLLTNTQLCTYPYKRAQIRHLLHSLLSHGHLRDISATTRRLVDRCLKAEWCVELSQLDGTSSIATVEPIGGVGQTHDKQMHSGVTSEGLPMLSTRIKEGSKAVNATTQSITITTDDPAVSPASTVDSFPHSQSPVLAFKPARTDSLSVPSTLRTRDKRVLSLSHPKSGAVQQDPVVARPGSAASVSDLNKRNDARRTFSAQSAPCTPPRVESPAGGQYTRRQYSDDGYEVPVDADSEDVASASSSWHAHMAEDPATRQPTRKALDNAGPESEGRAVPINVAHTHVVQDGMLGSSPPVGSPLCHDSTASTIHRGNDHGAAEYGGASAAGDSLPAPRRRKPPQPPTVTSAQTAARRAMQLSQSESLFSTSPLTASDTSRPQSPFVPASASQVDLMAPLTPVVSGGARRRPPPPPPTTTTTTTSKHKFPTVDTLDDHHHDSDTTANADTRPDDGTESMSRDQSFYLADRLRRGLHIS